VLVGVPAVADADQGAACGLDLLGDGHEVAVAADDDDGTDVSEAADVFGGVEAELDVGAVLGGGARREELDQLDSALQERVAIAAEVLPVAVGPVDGDGPEGGAEFNQGLDVDQWFLDLESVVLLGVGTFAVLGLHEACMQVLKIPIEGDGSVVVVVVRVHGVLPPGLVRVIVAPPGEVSLAGYVRPEGVVAGACVAAGAFRSPWAWASPRCAGPGCRAARRATGVPASRP
jgi:hypothetical protein